MDVCEVSAGQEAGWYLGFVGIVLVSMSLPALFINNKRQLEILGLTVPYMGSIPYVYGNLARLGNCFYKEKIGKLRHVDYSTLKLIGRLIFVQWLVLYGVVGSSLWLVWREACWSDGWPALLSILLSVVAASLFTPAYNIWFAEEWVVPYALNVLALVMAVLGLVLGAVEIDLISVYIPLMSVYVAALSISVWTQTFQPYTFFFQKLASTVDLRDIDSITMVGKRWGDSDQDMNPQSPIFRFECLNRAEYNPPTEYDFVEM